MAGAVAFQAKSPEIAEVAFATAFGDRQNVVGIPETFAGSGDAPVLKCFEAGRAA